MFANRAEAGEELANKLATHADRDCIVLALPRGGIETGYPVAKNLKCPLDVLPIRKVGKPGSPEFAIGAVNENGMLILDEGVSPDDSEIKRVIDKEKEESARRAALFRAGRPPLNITGKTVILVDDGIATGMTMKLAAMIAMSMKPKKIVIAVPVASEDALQELKKTGADIVVLEPPKNFRGAVGAHYIEFAQVKDDEVIRLLRAAQE